MGSEKTLLEKTYDNLDKNPNVLPYIYAEQMEWARHFNGLIWNISTILVPFAFAGFALSFRDQKGNPDVTTLVFVAAGSVALLVFWLDLGDRHRELWEQALRLPYMIEAIWLLRERSESPGALRGHLLKPMSSEGRGAALRRGLVWFGMLGWYLRVLCAYGPPTRESAAIAPLAVGIGIALPWLALFLADWMDRD